MKERLWTKNYTLLLLANIFTCFSYIAISTIITLYINDIGGNNRVAGIMTAAMTFLTMLSRPLIGKLLDSFGRRPFLVLGAILFALMTAAYCIAGTIPVLTAVRLLYGITMVCYTASTNTMLSDIIPQARSVDGMAYFTISSSLSCALGPVLGQMLYTQLGAFALFAIMAICAGVGSIATILVRVPAEVRADASAHAGTGLFKNILESSSLWPGLIFCFASVGYASMQNFLITCGEARNVSGVSLFFAVQNCAIIAASLISGRMTAKLGFSQSVFWSIIAATLGVLLTAFAGTLSLFLLAALLFGFGYGVLQPVLYALVFRFSPSDRRGAAIATYGLLTDAGSCVSSVLCGEISEVAGYTSAYLVAAALVALGIVMHLFGLRKKLHTAPKGFF